MEGLRVARGGDAGEPDLALPAQRLERRQNFVHHLPDTQRGAAARGGDRVVAMQDVDRLPAEPPQAFLERLRNTVRDLRSAGWKAHFRPHNRVLGLQLAEDATEVALRRPVPVLDGSIEVVHAGIERPADRAFLVGRIAPHHQPAHGAAAEAQDRKPQSAAAESSHLHQALQMRGKRFESSRSPCFRPGSDVGIATSPRRTQ